jgi:lambda family phage portal protein
MTERKPPAAAPKGWLDRLGGAFDSLVCALSPERGVKRLQFRHIHSASQERQARAAYTDGGERTATRESSWLGSRLSPDSGLEQDLDSLRNKARELYRTDSIGGVIESRTNLVVSYGFTPQARIAERAGLATAAQAEVWNAELEEVFARISPKIGKNGKTSLWQLSRLIERHHGVDGESFTILSDRGDADKPIPLIVEVVDPERVETPAEFIGDPRVRMGIRHDAGGMIEGYYIRDSHPGDTVDWKQTYKFYKADRVLHVFEAWFAGQSRAFPWLTRAINRCKDAKDLDEAAIIAAQVEACSAAFVTPGIGTGVSAAMNAATGTQGSRKTEEIRPGMIRYLDDGEQITFSNPTKTNGYDALQGWNYKRVSVGMAFPYQMISNDWSGLSFAGGRLVLTNAKLFVQAQQELLIEMWFSQIWNRLVYEAVTVGACSIPPRLYVKNPWWFSKCEWNPPAWSYSINPGEEVNADLDEVNGNLATLASKIAQRGGDYADVMKQRQREVAEQKAKGIEPAAAEVPSATLEQQVEKQKQLAGAA